MISSIIIALVALMYVIDLVITLVNYQYRHQPIPDIAKDIYDQEKYQKWLSYFMETNRFGVIDKTINTALLLVLLGFGFFGWLEQLTLQWFTHPILQTLTQNFLCGYFEKYTGGSRVGWGIGGIAECNLSAICWSDLVVCAICLGYPHRGDGHIVCIEYQSLCKDFQQAHTIARRRITRQNSSAGRESWFQCQSHFGDGCLQTLHQTECLFQRLGKNERGGFIRYSG